MSPLRRCSIGSCRSLTRNLGQVCDDCDRKMRGGKPELDADDEDRSKDPIPDEVKRLVRDRIGM